MPKSLAAVVQDPVAFNDALAVLRRYSLMEVADEALAVHRLVQAVVRDRLTRKPGKEQWAGAAVEMVRRRFPQEYRDKGGDLAPVCPPASPYRQRRRATPNT